MAHMFSLPVPKVGKSLKKSVAAMYPFTPRSMTNLSSIIRLIIP